MSDDYFKLPLRLLGLKNMPAVPLDIEGMVDTLIRLDIRSKESAQATQSLTQIFTLDDETARSHAFLFGGEPIGDRASEARERLKNVLSGNRLKVLGNLAGHLKDEGEELLDGLFDDDNEQVDLTKLSLDNPKQWAMSWTTLPEVARLGEPHLDRWAATVDVETQQAATEEFWPTIAEYGLSFNLLLPRKVDDTDIDEVRSIFGDTWSPALEAAFEARLLYVIDLRIYEALEHQKADGSVRFTPSTVTLMIQDAETRAMTPELIRVAGHEGAGAKIFSRPAGAPADGRGATTDAAWVYALQAAKTSVTVYGIWFGHVYHWHIVTAAMQMTMFCEIDEDHAVRKLLDPQSNFLIPFDDVLLVLFRSIAPPTSIKSGLQFLKLLNLFAKDREFFDDDPTVTLARLGIEEEDFSVDHPWDRYPIVGQLLSVWEATGKYVDTFVTQNFQTDEDVAEDRQLQKWIKASGKKRCGNVRGLPEMDSREALRRVLHSLVYRVTAHGVGRLYRLANPALTFVANFPPCLQDASIPEPTAKFDTETLLRYLPKTGTIGGMVTFYFTFSFSVPYVPFVPIEGIATNLYLDDEISNDALVDFRKFIVQFIESFEPETPQIYQWPLNIET